MALVGFLLLLVFYYHYLSESTLPPGHGHLLFCFDYFVDSNRESKDFRDVLLGTLA